MAFLGEIKRRKVFQVAAVYLVVAWLIMQVVDVVSGPLLLPDLFARIVIVVLAIGFPITVLISWAFDLTPQGVVKDQGTSQSSGRRIEYALIGLLILATGWVLYRVEITAPEPSVETVADVIQRDVLPNSVAVIPFENISPDPDDAYFAIGIHEEILNQLAKLSALNIIARTSVLQYAGTEKPIPEIAAEMNVETVLEGSVRYAGGQVRITIQLNDGVTGAHLWSETYTRDFEDIFAIESDVAMNVANALAAEFSIEEQQSIERAPTDSPAAYALYLRARALVPNIGPIQPPEFFELLNRALELDPNFSSAHAILAFAYGLEFANPLDAPRESSGVWQLTQNELEALARQHIDRAISIDPAQGLAYGALGFLDAAHWRLAEAQSNFVTAVALSPNDFDVLNDAVLVLAWTGKADIALPFVTRSLELNPQGSETELFWSAGSGDHDGFLSLLRQRINDRPALARNPLFRLFLARQEAIVGNADAALAEVQSFEELLAASAERQDIPRERQVYVVQLAYLHGRLGRADEARRRFELFQSVAVETGESDTTRAPDQVLANLAIGDQVEALRWLEIIADDPGPETGRFGFKASLVWNHYSDPVLDQPEFLEARRRLGFGE